MPVTIRDVAKEAGVSPMAVSKVLHGRGDTVRVSEAAAVRIKSVAEKLCYQPNLLAQIFRNKKTDTIAVVFEEFKRLGGNTGYFIELFDGVMSAAFERGYSVTVCPKLVNFSESGVAYDGRFDGLIWCKPNLTASTLAAMNQSQVPIVALHAPREQNSKFPSFCCDNHRGMELAINHLLQLGHRKISFVVDPSNAGSSEAEDRLSACQSALQKHNLKLHGFFHWSHTAIELGSHFRDGQVGTAIIAYGEGQAGELISRAKEAGINVPQELSICGFDSTQFCETTSPRLSAIRQPIEEMARMAALTLIDQIEGNQKNAVMAIFPCSLDIRESTGVAPNNSQPTGVLA